MDNVDNRVVNYPKGSGRTLAASPPADIPASYSPATREVLPTQTKTVPGQTKRGVMNKLETRWAQELEFRRRAGEVAWYRFESLTLKLADGCRYTPDFLVCLSDGTLELHECKGFMREDAHIKLKICAEMYPFRLRLVRRVKGNWLVTVVGEKSMAGPEM